MEFALDVVVVVGERVARRIRASCSDTTAELFAKILSRGSARSKAAEARRARSERRQGSMNFGSRQIPVS